MRARPPGHGDLPGGPLMSDKPYCPLATVEMIDGTFPVHWISNPQHYVDQFNRAISRFCEVATFVGRADAGLEAFGLCFTPRDPGPLDCICYNKLSQALGYGDVFPHNMAMGPGLKALAAKGKKSDARMPAPPVESAPAPFEPVVTLADIAQRLDRIEALLTAKAAD